VTPHESNTAAPLDEAPALRFIEQALQAELYQGLLRPNPLCEHRELLRAKARSYRARWPWLRITDPGQPVAAARA